MIDMIEPSSLLILGLVALAAGFIDAVAGGGGMLTVPALLSLAFRLTLRLGLTNSPPVLLHQQPHGPIIRNNYLSLSFGEHLLLRPLSGQLLAPLSLTSLAELG